MKSQCKICKRRFKTLTEDNLCYFCHLEKYNKVPTKGVYSQEKEKKQ